MIIESDQIVYLLLIFSIFRCFVDGQLIRDRTVQCNSNEMMVSFEFAQPFSGVVYANKFYQSKGCKWDGDGSRRLQLPIPINSNPTNQPYCGVQLKEAIGEFTVTLIVSPMKSLLVEGMEGVTVRCLYTIADITLTLPAGSNGAGIFVSYDHRLPNQYHSHSPQTQAGVVTGSGGSPFLQMAIRDGHGISGDIIQTAQVGQRLSLDVVMRDTTIYDFYVHDCYAHDGTNVPDASVSVVDPNGCAVRLNRAVDVPVFTSSPVPNGGAKHVYVHMYGFQFTTSQLVYFECQVRPCLQTCSRAQCISQSVVESSTTASSPPSVRIRRSDNGIRNLTTAVSSEEEYQDNYNLTTVIRMEQQDVVENAVTEISDAVIYASPGNANSEICINMSMAAAILTIFIIVCIVSLIVSVFICFRAKSRKCDDKSVATPTSTTNVSFTPSATMGRMSLDGSRVSYTSEYSQKIFKLPSTVLRRAEL